MRIKSSTLSKNIFDPVIMNKNVNGIPIIDIRIETTFPMPETGTL